MAVLPEYQHTGIGPQIVDAGLEACKDIGYGIVVVLWLRPTTHGFGFTLVKPYGIVWEHHAPKEAFVAKERPEGALALTRGAVRYRAEFDAVQTVRKSKSQGPGR